MNNIRRLAIFFLFSLILTIAGIFLLREHRGVVTAPPDQITSWLGTTSSTGSGSAALPDKHDIAESYGKLPMNFEPNVGQTEESVRFVSREDADIRCF